MRETRREILHEGAVFRLERRHIVMAGQTFERDVVVHPGAVVLLAVQRGSVLLVRQWRHPIGTLLELPAGTLEAGEDPRSCAARELREEVGLGAGVLEPFGEAYAAPGYSTELLYFFRCKHLRPAPLQRDADEAIEVVRLPVREALARVRRGETHDAKTALGILLGLGRTGLRAAKAPH